MAAFLSLLDRGLAARRAPLVVALATALLSAWVWRGLDEPGDVHDELAYLLQAETYARGRLALPSPPIPAFFEQYHVLVTPTLASKYPPGHALLLAPGVALGLPGLVPVLLAGASGGFLFALARSAANGWVAGLTWLLWLTAPAGLGFRASYLSQVTTTALWLSACWFLWEWCRSGKRTSLLVVAGLLGWMALTRPLTAAALGLPIGCVVVTLTIRRRAWRDFGAALSIGLAVLAVVPITNAAVTGDWATAPYALHTRTYLPFVRLGFGLEDRPTLRDLPPDMQRFNEGYKAVHRDHTLAALPATAARRLWATGAQMWGGARWREPLVVLALVGLIVLSRPGLFAVASFLCLFAAHLLYAHPLGWLVYYEETQPVPAFLMALGLQATIDRRTIKRPLLLGATLLIAGLGLHDALLVRRHWPDRASWRKGMAAAMARIPDTKAVVFIRHSPGHDPDRSIVVNDPDGPSARLWLVHDRGPDENQQLLQAAPDRAPWLFDEARGWLRPYRPDEDPEGTSTARK